MEPVFQHRARRHLSQVLGDVDPARFTRLAHTGGKVEIVAAIPTEDFPFTLDLRRG